MTILILLTSTTQNIYITSSSTRKRDSLLGGLRNEIFHLGKNMVENVGYHPLTFISSPHERVESTEQVNNEEIFPFNSSTSDCYWKILKTFEIFFHQMSKVSQISNFLLMKLRNKNSFSTWLDLVSSFELNWIDAYWRLQVDSTTLFCGDYWVFKMNIFVISFNWKLLQKAKLRIVIPSDFDNLQLTKRFQNAILCDFESRSNCQFISC